MHQGLVVFQLVHGFGAISGPVPDGGVVIGCPLVAHQTHNKIGIRAPDAGGAIGGHFFVRGDAFGREQLLHLRVFQDGFVRLKTAFIRNMHRAPDMAASFFTVKLPPDIFCVVSGVDDDKIRVIHSIRDMFFIGHNAFVNFGLEFDRPPGLDCGFRRVAVRRPFVPATVQNTDIRAAQKFEHPEQPSCGAPACRGIVINNHPGIPLYAGGAQQHLQLVYRLQIQTGIRKLLPRQTDGSRNMAGVICLRATGVHNHHTGVEQMPLVGQQPAIGIPFCRRIDGGIHFSLGGIAASPNPGKQKSHAEPANEQTFKQTLIAKHSLTSIF